MPRPTNDNWRPGAVVRISREDLDAYIADRLGALKAAEVEGFLACNPDLAARVMQARHMRAREAGGAAAGGRRPRGSSRRAAAGLAAAAAVTIGLFGAGVLGYAAFPAAGAQAAVPGYVDEAVMSRRATLIRTAMRSQLETPTLDAAEIERAMNLRLPAIPASWRILDVQVYPSDDGPSVAMLVETARGRQLNLFAVRVDTPVADTPLFARAGGDHVAYWEDGGTAYVLAGDIARQEILTEAAQLAPRRRS